MAEATLIKPDREFVERIVGQGGENLKQCFQCATCSVVCELAPERRPFPRKEMIWSQWGMKDRLLADPDIWLCYQCNDCSIHCPRGARPGDVMGALRRETVIHYGVPAFFGRLVNDLRFAPVLLFIPAVLLGLAILLNEKVLKIFPELGGRVIYSYSPWLPHWLIISFFGFFSVLTVLILMAGAARYWGAMKASDERLGSFKAAGGIGQAFGAAFKSILTHQDFDKCTTEKPRYASHLLVFFGFIALGVVPIWIISGSIFNPLIRDSFVYPFHFLNPWRVLANLGGFAVMAGCLLMIRDRLTDDSRTGSYFDWAFLLTVLGVVATGFASEFLHYARLEPHRHLVYFGHLVLVLALIMYLPYSKFAHLVYRTTAMAYSEYSGRSATAPVPQAAPAADEAKAGEAKAEDGAKEGESKEGEAKKEEKKPEGTE